MVKRVHPHELGAHVALLVESSIRDGVPAEIARDAGCRTLRAVGDTPTWATAAKRADGYFWAVVRRTLVRQRRGTDVTARFVLAAVVDDLLESGRDGHEVWAELERGWSDKVPRDVLVCQAWPGKKKVSDDAIRVALTRLKKALSDKHCLVNFHYCRDTAIRDT